MKSKFLNFITICLVTSLLLEPTQRAFGFSTEPQTNNKQTRLLVNDISGLTANSNWTDELKLLQEDKAVTEASQISDSSQSNSVEPTASVSDNSNAVGGVFVTFLFIGYILVGLQYRKHRVHRAAVLLQQIETLERIWKMNPQQR